MIPPRPNMNCINGPGPSGNQNDDDEDDDHEDR